MRNQDAQYRTVCIRVIPVGMHRETEANVLEGESGATVPSAKPLPSSGTRTTAAIVFIDLTEFTGLSEEVGLDATHMILTQFHAVVGSAAATSDGRVVAHLGDGAMMVFAGGRSPAENAVRAVVACGNLVRRMSAWMSAKNEVTLPDGYRIGAHLGEVVMAEPCHRYDRGATPLGDAVNVAHRLLEVAKDRRAQIALSEDLVQAASTLVPEFAHNLRRREQVAIRGRKKGISVRLVYAPATLAAPETCVPSIRPVPSVQPLRKWG